MGEHLLDAHELVLLLGRDEGVGGDGMRVRAGDGSHDGVFLFVGVDGAVVVEVVLEGRIGVDGSLCR